MYANSIRKITSVLIFYSHEERACLFARRRYTDLMISERKGVSFAV